MSRFGLAVAALAMPAAVGAIIFVSAGGWDLPFVWGVLGVLAVLSVSVALTVDRGLIRERVKPGPGNRDRFTRRIGSALLLVHWILVGLDVGRFHWSPVAWEVQLAGLVGYAVAMVVLFWAVTTNPF